MIIRNPMYITTAEGHVLSKIYAYMLNDYFAPYLYQALLAENYWQLRLDPDGLILSMWGFSDSIPKGKLLTEIQTLVLLVYYCSIVANRMAELIADFEPDQGNAF